MTGPGFDMDTWRRDFLTINSDAKQLVEGWMDGWGRRFQINPEKLKTRGEIPKPDYDAGRCDQIQKNGLRCNNDAKWSVLTRTGERAVCGVHVRALRDHPDTAAVEPL